MMTPRTPARTPARTPGRTPGRALAHAAAPAIAAAAATLLSACGTLMTPAPMFSQATLPDAVKVPAGHRVVMETVGVGEITYECRAKAGMAGMAGMASQFEWAFVGPDATLMDRAGKTVGRYYGPPATWESIDGSRLTATQLAVAPAGNGNIPLQLVKANPAMGMGAMQGVSHIQRVATRGGLPIASACGQMNLGSKQTVKYQADYIFWKMG